MSVWGHVRAIPFLGCLLSLSLGAVFCGSVSYRYHCVPGSLDLCKDSTPLGTAPTQERSLPLPLRTYITTVPAAHREKTQRKEERERRRKRKKVKGEVTCAVLHITTASIQFGCKALKNPNEKGRLIKPQGTSAFGFLE